MRGAQGPGDARGERPIVRDRAPSRRVYTMRRLLAALILLLLLALLVPLACQALLGSEDEGPRADRGDGTPEKAAGVAANTEDAAEEADTRDNPTDAGATETARDAGSEQAREDGEEQNDGAATDLGEILTENLSVVVTEPAEPGGASADRTAQSTSDSGDEWRVDRLASISQQRPPATRSASTRRQPSARRRAPAERPGTDSFNTAGAVEKPPPEPATATVASAPGPVLELGLKPIPEPVSVPVRQVAAAPIRPVPVPVLRGTPGRRGASIAANAVNAATNFGGGVAGARGNNGAAFPGAGAVRGASAGRLVF
jgi:hypothetical protein